MSVQTKRTRTQKVRDRLDQAKEVAEIGRTVAPPGVRGPIQTGEDIIDIAETGIDIANKVTSIFKKKKKKKK